MREPIPWEPASSPVSLERPRPYVILAPVQIGGRTLRAQIDTGSTFSFVSWKGAAQLGITPAMLALNLEVSVRSRDTDATNGTGATSLKPTISNSGLLACSRSSRRSRVANPVRRSMLDRPEIPLHTNGSERDIRCHVTKRKISGGTRSDAGRDCRDAFLGLMHTCAKLGIAFWDYLGDRLGIIGHPSVPALPHLIRCRGHPA